MGPLLLLALRYVQILEQTSRLRAACTHCGRRLPSTVYLVGALPGMIAAEDVQSSPSEADLAKRTHDEDRTTVSGQMEDPQVGCAAL